MNSRLARRLASVALTGTLFSVWAGCAPPPSEDDADDAGAAFDASLDQSLANAPATAEIEDGVDEPGVSVRGTVPGAL
jgi:hypothetical protein